MMKEIKRRDPKHYIKNPTKTYCLSQGRKDYAFHDMAKANKITNHSNIHSPVRNQYKHIIGQAPKMT